MHVFSFVCASCCDPQRDVEELVVFKHKHFAEFGLVDTAEDCDARLTARVAEVAAPIREILGMRWCV